MIVILIPAAGRSSRMWGADKLLQTIHAAPILTRTANTALNANLGPVLVALRPDDTERRNALNGLNVTCIDVPDADEGMAASLRHGAAKAHALLREPHHSESQSGMMVLLPDMPDIDEGDLQKIATRFTASGNTPHRAATKDGTPGHPVLFPSRLLPNFVNLTADEGARLLLANEDVTTVPLSGARATTDLDTPEDWPTWRNATNTPD